MLILRESTAGHHRRAEQHPFQQQMVRGTLPRVRYIHWLAQMLHIHTALESHLDQLVTRNLQLKAVFDDGRRRVDALRRDLSYFGAPADPPPLPAARSLMARMDQLATDHPLALLGILYVLEGSTNGSKFIARRARPTYELPATGEGAAYLDPYGNLQPARWQDFKAAMDALDLSAAEVAHLTLAAQETFDAIRELGAELLEASPS
jgi:heme oxygenase